MIKSIFQIECYRCDARRSFSNEFARSQWKHHHWRRCKGLVGESELHFGYDECEFCGNVGFVFYDSKLLSDGPAWCGRCEETDLIVKQMEAVG